MTHGAARLGASPACTGNGIPRAGGVLSLSPPTQGTCVTAATVCPPSPVREGDAGRVGDARAVFPTLELACVRHSQLSNPPCSPFDL